MEPPTHLRLLPWLSAEGKPCFLAPADKGGYLSALADETESLQMDAGTEALVCARRVLDNPCVPNVEVRYAAIRLAECLGDILRVAESRGHRLAASAAAAAAEDDDPVEDAADAC
ncbi:hypothetical protein [Streptomyces sp. MAR4 CNX-425]|uniref:hypothetical protein n=1 Tax=Streptomyces sp. MAR4 CNX-425 TaxID=3406343 RepID=UPI003B508C20